MRPKSLHRILLIYLEESQKAVWELERLSLEMINYHSGCQRNSTSVKSNCCIFIDKSIALEPIQFILLRRQNSRVGMAMAVELPLLFTFLPLNFEWSRFESQTFAPPGHPFAKYAYERQINQNQFDKCNILCICLVHTEENRLAHASLLSYIRIVLAQMSGEKPNQF